MVKHRRTNQTFQRYDVVLVDKDYPWIIQGGNPPKVVAYQIGAGERAVVCGSYYDQYGGGAREREQYSLLFKKHGRVSWYDGDKLKLIHENRPDLFEKWSRKDVE